MIGAAQAVAAVRSVKLMHFYDDLVALGYSMTLLFESSTPGATASLRAWAESSGHRIAERSITPPGAPTVYELSVTIRNSDGTFGAHISVQRTAAS